MTAIQEAYLDQVTCPRCGAKSRTGVVVITVDALERVLSEGEAMERMNLRMKHGAVLAAFLVSLGPQLSGLPNGWHDAVTPTFIGALVAQVGAIIAAVIVGSPFGRQATATPQADRGLPAVAYGAKAGGVK